MKLVLSAATVLAASINMACAQSENMPDTQKRFLASIEKAKETFKNGSNDMQRGSARPIRAKDICSIISSRSASGWLGKVYDLSSNGDGKGVVVLTIADGVYIQTWNNAVSDSWDRTLIEPGTKIFESAANLKKGQWVKFSGSFPKSDTDCIRESSMSLSGSIKEPEFIIRFSSISALN